MDSMMDHLRFLFPADRHTPYSHVVFSSAGIRSVGGDIRFRISDEQRPDHFFVLRRAEEAVEKGKHAKRSRGAHKWKNMIK
jgi:hypothetical protein